MIEAVKLNFILVDSFYIKGHDVASQIDVPSNKAR